MQDLFSSSFFNALNIVLLISLGFCLIVSLIFYIHYYYAPLKYVNNKTNDNSHKSTRQNTPMVSVIIESENEAARLAQNLPYILEQDYPNFEVIVVNKGSTDESDDILQALSVKYKNLYNTFIPQSYDRSLSTRKLALMVGIKAAKGDILLFTEAYSKPISKNWIKLMVQDMDQEKQVALGYSYYKETDRLTNRIARFDNLLFSMQYLSAAIYNKPYIGVYRNIAYDKSLFFDNKGFASCLRFNSGEELFIHRIINDSNTIVVLNQGSFIETDIENYSLWRQIKKTYSVAKSKFDGYRAHLFSIEYALRYIFYALLILVITNAIINSNWVLLGIACLFFAINLVAKIIIINKLAKYFQAGKFQFSLFIIELLQPIYNLRFRSRQKKHKRNL